MKKEKIKLSKPNKILLAMLELSGGKKTAIKFEDLVVALFKNYKEDFHLRGYPKYPDSESVNKAIYSNLKRNGFVDYGNKVFSLTDKGLNFVKDLKKSVINKKITSHTRLPRFVEREIIRIKKLDGFKLFLNNNLEKIFDTDFYNYLGMSVKTEKDEFLGRLRILEDTMDELKKKKNQDLIFEQIIKYHDFIVDKFKNIINYNKKNN